MKANEFRIGNWVNEIRCDGKLYPSQITHIQTRDGFNKIKCNGWFADSPIPLTEEWLLKFGFVKNNDEWILDPSFNVRIIIYNTDNYNGVMFYTRTIHTDFTPIYCNKIINNVQQLQNLYFALTGEELTIKE